MEQVNILVLLPLAQFILFFFTVYFSFPDPNSPPTWYFLGFICNQKPSAIFKITKLKQASISGEQPSNAFGYVQPIVSHNAQIGISIEPLSNISQINVDPSITGGDSNGNQLSKFDEFTVRTAENLYNYCASFANNINHFITTGQSNQQFIPMATINEWYKRFKRNLEQNPNFWK